MLSTLAGEHIEISETLNIDFESQTCDLKKYCNTHLNGKSTFPIRRTLFLVVLLHAQHIECEVTKSFFNSTVCGEKIRALCCRHYLVNTSKFLRLSI